VDRKRTKKVKWQTKEMDKAKQSSHYPIGSAPEGRERTAIQERIQAVFVYITRISI
jgi:hypothetical protein